MNELTQKETERDILTNRGYMMLLEQIPILAIPAFVAIFVAKRLAPVLDITEKYLVAGFLLAALVVSWKIIFYRLNTFNAQLRQVSAQIRELKAKQKSSEKEEK